ncbi:ATP-binding cassette domain-containing protein [Candidatus Pelagibacter bacterium]|nr:ATP-binding cassette domain-containing protein [Candidatus Pelagibacter bacterium]
MSFLKIKNLSVDYHMRKETVYAAKNVNIEVNKGEILGLVGESGSGKSTVGNAIINLIDAPGKVSSGSVILGDLNIHEDPKNIVKYRGKKIGLIFQDPQTSLNPILTVGEQLIETIQTHLDLTNDEAKNKSIDLLKEVGIKDAEKRFNNYPHQFSGGMRQRVVISLALCCEPELLIADEPTTALDVSIQSQILELIKKLTKERNLAVILITHDMGVIAETADRVAVMKSGNLVEIGETKEIIQSILDEYQSGIQITQVQTQKADPPDQVIDAFRDVQAARADMERSKNEAEAYANDVIPRARGEAAKIMQAAEAYKQQVVAASEGEASRFNSIYNEYAKAKEVTQERMYLETMEKVLADIDKVIIEKGAGSGVVPYLPLPELGKKKVSN